MPAAGWAWVFAAAAGALLVALAGCLRTRRRHAADSAERETRLSLLDAMVAGAPDAHWSWEIDGGGEKHSARLAALLGVAEDDTGLDAFLRRLGADQAQSLSDALAALRAGGDDFVMAVSEASGSRHFSVSGRLLRDGAGAAAMSVLWLHDTSHAEAAKAEARGLHDILNALPLPVWRRGADLALAYCNRAYADFVECTADEAVAGSVELIGDAGSERARALAARASEGGEARDADEHVVIGGARRLLHIDETPLKETELTDEAGTVGIAWDITDLEDSNRNLASHIGAHTDVLERLGTAIAIYGPEKQLRFFNSAYANLWRLDVDWLHGEPMFGEVLEALRAKRRLPEVPDFPAFKRKREALFTGLIEAAEEILHLPDGRTLRMFTTPHPFGGILHTYEDVTDTLALERRLNTQLAVQRATLDKLYEGVAVFGSDGRLKLSNPGFAHLWRLKPEDLDGEPHISEVVEKTRNLYDYGDDWESFKAELISRTTERQATSDRLERRDGAVLEWASVPLPDGATLMTYLDVTDSIKVERALRERAEALEQADHLKSAFIANVSYELRTPLNTIIGFSELLSTKYFGKLNTRQVEYVEGILDSSNHLLHLINDILDLASIEAGQMQLDVASFDLDAVLTAMLDLTHERSRAEDVTLEFDCAEDLGQIVGDERRIKQVFFHLLTNAIKFTPPGGKVVLKARRSGDSVTVSVIDTGTGIAADDQPLVFDKFWRSEEAQTKHGSSGLGLSLVKSFVELHGGSVDLTSEPGAGTSVTCRLPVKARAPSKAPDKRRSA